MNVSNKAVVWFPWLVRSWGLRERLNKVAREIARPYFQHDDDDDDDDGGVGVGDGDGDGDDDDDDEDGGGGSDDDDYDDDYGITLNNKSSVKIKYTSTYQVNYKIIKP